MCMGRDGEMDSHGPDTDGHGRRGTKRDEDGAREGRPYDTDGHSTDNQRTTSGQARVIDG